MARTDEELVDAFQRGESAAFDELLSRWQRRILGAIYRVVGREEEARDICQEAFLKAYRALGGFKREARFSSWMYQIALNLCRDRLRRRKGRTLVPIDDMGALDELRPGLHGDAAGDVESRDLAQLVSRAVGTLPADQREVIVLKEYEGLTFTEIAETLQVPVSTVKTRLYRGLVVLRGELERQGVRSASAVAVPVP
jgi:RNA polymerase sigma-70 factor (ECF subfamily)